ncbi:MAG TPA: SH3 domain-containing protein, partial [Anaerolineales bacterium]|nr:SH3 domain-containing protein [Anaerolineales bacterium]
MATPADPGRRHRLHRTLITVILLTVPFYVAGFAALQFLPDPGAGADASTPTVTTAPPKVSTLLPRTTPTDTPAPPTPEPLAMVNVAWGNLRSGPGTVYVVVAQLDEGTELAPLERNELADWLRVEVKGTGKQGWIS